MQEPSQGRSLPWFRVDVDLVEHPKVTALAEIWGVSEAEAGWSIVRLWAWTMRYAARGRLAPGARTALGRLAPVRVTLDLVVRGLVETGWLDENSDGSWEVHDWAEHNGAAVVKAEKDAERKRTARARRADGAETARAGRADGAGNGTERNGTERIQRPANKSRGVEQPVDPRHHPLKLALLAAFEESQGSTCAFDGRQAKAVTRLLALGPDEEILRRWKAALAHKGFPTVRTPGELVTHWNHFAPASGEFAGTFLKEVLF